jgi:hypothetical protein
MKTKKKIGCFLMLVSFVIVSFMGCAGIGPGTVTRDRSDYIAAISDSWKHQMLLNMVKIRYGDAPVFLDVSSVISQYQLAGQVNLGATVSNDPFNTSQTLGAMGQYVDRPTVTYTPILGDKFARSLMSPVPPAAILSLMQSGYQVDLVFRLLVQEINGIGNRFGGDVRARSADPEFYSLLQKMRKIQSAGSMGMRVKKIDKQENFSMIFREKQDPAINTLSKEVRAILGLDPKTTEFKIVYGAVSQDNKEIAVLTRSFLEVIVDLAADIEVPDIHVEEKRVNPVYVEKTIEGQNILPLIRIRCSLTKPGDAFVVVSYRNSYFWIDDRDLMSKKMFSFLMFVLTLVETGEKGSTPIVTIPAG